MNNSEVKTFSNQEILKRISDNKLTLGGYSIYTIDGVRVKFPDGFALVRASNTGPDLTVRFEARTKERLHEIKEEFRLVIKKYIETH